METRAVLGGHVSPGLVSVFTYSRDELAQPTRAIETLAKQIRAHQFDPDAMRSGRWLPSPSIETPRVAEPQVPDLAEEERVIVEDALSSSSYSTADELEQGSEVDETVSPGVQVAVHLRSGVTHRVLDGECTFACGRQRSLNYEEGPLETSEGA
eukprot:6478239-Amphidinium_carterae.1